MFSVNEKKAVVKTRQTQTLIVGRLAVIFLLLVVSWILDGGHLDFTAATFPKDIFLVFIISIALAFVYTLVLRFNGSYARQTRAQFIVDALLVTWLVWHTGDLSSPFILLYVVLISVSSIYLNPRGTIFLAALCSALFTVFSGLIVAKILPTYSAALPETSKIISIIGFHDAAFLIVGLLAARLADRSASSEELKKATKSLANLRALHERIVESIRSGLITTDLDGTIYTFNAAAAEITGYTAQEMRGKPISALLGNVFDKINLSLETTETGDSQPRFETDIITPDGFAVRIGYNISPLFSETNETTGLIITFQDLTLIRSMEESVRRKDRLAAVGRVAAGLAHEIRNPLGAMRVAIQVLESKLPPDSSQTSLIEIILRESDRLNKIIVNFLTYARPRVANFAETDISEAIAETVTLLKHSPDLKENHALRAETPDQPIFIAADATQLKQVFWNLARNAIQAMPDGGELKIKLETTPLDRVQIVFSDTGCGMSASQVEQLFEPFANSTTGGTGLGLSIVYQIVRDHQGTINVRSLEGKGTTIIIEMPTETKTVSIENSDEEIEQTAISSRLEGLLNVQANSGQTAANHPKPENG